MKKHDTGDTNPIDSRNKVQQSNDEHIDQDFKGYPHHPAKENIINPLSKEDRLSAGVENNTQSIKSKRSSKEKSVISTGSGGAFNATERLDENNDSEPKDDDEEVY